MILQLLSCIYSEFKGILRYCLQKLWSREPLCDEEDAGDEHVQLIKEAIIRGEVVKMSSLARALIPRRLNFFRNAPPSAFLEVYESLLEELFMKIPQSDAKELRDKIEFFQMLRRLHGNTALMLSGGGSMGTHHVGVMKALYDSNLMPTIVCGSSSGAIMASIACIKVREEHSRTLTLEGININMLGEPDGVSSPLLILFRRLKRFLIKVLEAAMRHNLGDITFLEAYAKTGRILNITISSPTVFEMPRLLNYLTAPNVLIWSAVVSSCAVPKFFTSSCLLAKNGDGHVVPWMMSKEGETWIDGSVENDIPSDRLSVLFNVNNFIVSQVNPHIYPFVILQQQNGWMASILQKLFFLFISETEFRLTQLIQLRIFPKYFHYLRSILTQRYMGDVTVAHKLGWIDYWNMFAPSKHGDVLRAIVQGEKATTPLLPLVVRQRRIEICLERILTSLKEQSSKLGLRRTSTNISYDNLIEELEWYGKFNAGPSTEPSWMDTK